MANIYHVVFIVNTHLFIKIKSDDFDCVMNKGKRTLIRFK